MAIPGTCSQAPHVQDQGQIMGQQGSATVSASTSGQSSGLVSVAEWILQQVPGSNCACDCYPIDNVKGKEWQDVTAHSFVIRRRFWGKGVAVCVCGGGARLGTHSEEVAGGGPPESTLAGARLGAAGPRGLQFPESSLRNFLRVLGETGSASPAPPAPPTPAEAGRARRIPRRGAGPPSVPPAEECGSSLPSPPRLDLRRSPADCALLAEGPCGGGSPGVSVFPRRPPARGERGTAGSAPSGTHPAPPCITGLGVARSEESGPVPPHARLKVASKAHKTIIRPSNEDSRDRPVHRGYPRDHHYTKATHGTPPRATVTNPLTPPSSPLLSPSQ